MASVHNEVMRVRLNDALLAEAAAKARRENMTLSELVRQAVRREVREVAE